LLQLTPPNIKLKSAKALKVLSLGLVKEVVSETTSCLSPPLKQASQALTLPVSVVW